MKTRINAPEGQPFIDIERDVDAPRELVHRAFLEPELVVQWLGPRKYRMTIDKWDGRAGGEYRYVHGNDEGEFAFHGVFHSMDIDNMVQTFEFEGWPGHVSHSSRSSSRISVAAGAGSATTPCTSPSPIATQWSRVAWARVSRTATTAWTS